MAIQEQVRARTYTSSAAIAQFRFVTASITTGLVAVTGAGGFAAGVSLSATTATAQILSVAYDGRVQVTAAGTIVAGANIASNAAGQALTATTGQFILGQALEAAVSGQLMTVELRRDGTLA